MSEEPKIKNIEKQAAFSRSVGEQAERKLMVRSKGSQGVWFGLGMMGLIGWSVVTPTLLGAWLGIWLDKSHPGIHSWTLTMLVIGLAVGCLNAWHWVAMENKAIGDEQEDSSE